MKNLQGIICLLIIFLFTNQAWTADWILYASTFAGHHYYDKSSINKVNKNIISVSTINVFNEDGKIWAFSYLQSIGKAPDNPAILSSMMAFAEINCNNETFRFSSGGIYDEKVKFLASLPKSIDQWGNIIPDSHIKTLKNIVCEEPATTHEAVVAPKVEEPVAPKEAVVASRVEKPVAPNEVFATSRIEEPVVPKKTLVMAPTVTDKNLAQVDHSKKNETKYIPETAVRNLVYKWLTSWKSGDLKTYHSCYASDFRSKGMNLDAWISHKTNVNRKSKNINISIDKLQISVDESSASVVFIQHYSSSIFKYSGKKKLELRKINDEWKIYREIM